MAKEIEHKYLVVSNEYISMSSASYEISQGYLNKDPERTVRVRIKGDKGYLTIKGKTIGDTRAEYEYEIPVEDARAMLELALPGVITKHRYIVPYKGYTWEVDKFTGRLEGLVTAEIELTESQHDYPLPPFVGEEVTDNPAYYNSNL